MITHPPPAMDEFLDQMFSLPSWNDMSGNAGRTSTPWDFNGATAAATRMGVDPQKLFTMSLLPQDGAHVGDGGLHPNDDNLLGDRLRGLQVNSAVSGLVSRGHGGATLTRSPSEGSNCSEGSGGPQSPPPVAPTWKQPYVGGVPPLPLGLGQAKPEPLLRGDTSDAHLGKRAGDDDDVSMREGSDPLREVAQGLFASFTGAQLAQSQLPRQGGHPSLQQGNDSSQGQGVSVYGAQGVNVQPQTGSAGVAAISARPRVRARRGQATDPHSIAERLRRERIAERMKALQDLVPNSNKTDKASMLDEIIDYVKFLQLQVKVLSMSRLGGAGAVAPLVADLPAEVTASMGRVNGVGVPGPSQDGMALTDRQVARLMEKDMGSAMQYLQSKGLCLMPISLATAISGTNSRSQAGNGVTDRQRSEATGPAVALNHGGSPSGTASGDGDAANTSGSGLAKNVNDGRGDGVEKSTEDSYTDFYKTGEQSTTSSHMGAVSTPSSYTDFDKSDVL